MKDSNLDNGLANDGWPRWSSATYAWTISLKVADEKDIIENGTLWVGGAQHPGPSGTGSQQLLGILRDEWGDANRELAAGFFLVCAAALTPL